MVGRQGWWGGKGGGAVSGIILLYLLRLTLLAFILTSNYTKYIVSVCQLMHIYLCLQESNLET